MHKAPLPLGVASHSRSGFHAGPDRNFGQRYGDWELGEGVGMGDGAIQKKRQTGNGLAFRFCGAIVYQSTLCDIPRVGGSI